MGNNEKEPCKGRFEVLQLNYEVALYSPAS